MIRRIRGILPRPLIELGKPVKKWFELLPYRMKAGFKMSAYRKKLEKLEFLRGQYFARWSFFDETDPQVEFLQQGIGYLRQPVEGRTGNGIQTEVTQEDSTSFRLRGVADNNDEWLVGVADLLGGIPNRYRVSLRFRKNTPFRELQFDFHYNGLGSRMRYRFEEGRVYYERIRKFVFEHEVNSVNCPIEVGRDYCLTIDVFERYSRLLLNDELLTENIDFVGVPGGGKFAIIAWETDSETPISLDVSEIKISLIKG